MLSELYQEAILDHSKRPRNFGQLPQHTHEAEGFNPLCGDQVRLQVQLEEGRIKDLAFEGCGCAISVASASMMTQAVKGKTVEEAEALFKDFQEVVTQKKEPDESLGELECLAGVRDFPSRIKCAVLAWHALHQAISGGGTASTE